MLKISLKPRIYFGTDILQEAVSAEKENIAGNVLVVTTGRSLMEYGHLASVVNAFNGLQNVNKVVVYDAVSQNPKLEEAVEAIALGG